jgi:hypothetical protein
VAEKIIKCKALQRPKRRGTRARLARIKELEAESDRKVYPNEKIEGDPRS